MRFSCGCKIDCINDLWSMFCKWMVDDEGLTRLERAKFPVFWGCPNTKLVLGVARRRSGLKEWVVRATLP